MSAVVLITGANGFLARAVAEQLPAAWQSIALVRTGTRCEDARHSARFDSVDALLSAVGTIDVVLHLAACIPGDHDAYHSRLLSVNVDLPSELVKAYPHARHVYASSVAVFGTAGSLPLTIHSASRQPSRYGLSKLAGECVIRQSQSHATIRYSSLIGRGMKPGSFIPSLVEGARARRICLYGDGYRQQNYLDVVDAASMCISAATDPRSFVTLGIGARSHSNLEVAQMVAQLSKASITHEGSDSSASWIYDMEGAIDLIQHRTPIENTLTEMLRI